jgi:soluble lytic murein transglycosylase
MLAAAGAGPAPAMDERHWSGAAPASADLATTGSVLPSRLTGLQTGSATSQDSDRLARLVGHIERGQIAEADAVLATIEGASIRLAGEWSVVRSGHPAVSVARIERFLTQNPDWTGAASLQKRAEEAMLSQRLAAPRVLAFFAERVPVAPAGRAALALALKQSADHERADALVRRLWRDDPLGRDVETLVLKAFAPVLTTRDHRNRMEMYLFRDNREAALRNAERAGPDHVKLAEARLAVARKSGGAAAALARVPQALHKDTSYLFAQAQHHRRRQEAEISARLIAVVPRDADTLVDGDEWWVERRLIARQLLDKGLHAEAYQVAARHAAEKPQSIIEAEWHAGWIALRFLHDPARAMPHFALAAAHAETPISRARAAFWQGRAAEALSDVAAARRHFEAAAEHPIAYYGQIARARLGRTDLPLRHVEAAPGATTHHPALGVIEALEAAGQHALARNLITEMARVLDEPAAMAWLAATAARVGDARLLVSIGKSAVQRGLPLDLTAYPVDAMPAFAPAGLSVERAMVFAIARQESAFDPAAISHAGARGLMQMMLPTARETARRVGIGFDAGRLTSDPAYNARLGAAHLGDLLRDWRGSYVLAFAAYNAGSGNVRDWIEAYGDPRSLGVDPVDWVERIPFSETRNYVQRVMENLQVYRTRLGDHQRLLIGLDLKRGLRTLRFAGEADTAHSMTVAASSQSVE